jgi:quercetin dioxygenase-like cupin family protein
MRTVLAPLIVTLCTIGLFAQDPVKTLPDSYSIQFENEWVRVIRVHYGPYGKLPAHTHNALPAAYVYLNDGGPVRFKHIGTSYGAATRPATKAGGVRVFRGIDEIHEVENTSELPSDFLRVEFKTDPKDVGTLKGKFYRELAEPGENLVKVQFENDQVRISRIFCAPGRSVQFTTAPAEPSLLVAVTDARLRESGIEAAVRTGQERWLAAGTTLGVENVGPASSEFLRFDFKTAPIPLITQR